jgi:HlyD family secretion protein
MPQLPSIELPSLRLSSLRLSSLGLTPRRALATIGLLALIGGFAWALWPKPVPADIGQVSLGPVLVTVDEEGRTRIKDVYTVSAPISGKVLRRHLEPGDPVKQNDTIVATIEPTAPPFLDVRALRELEAQAAAAKAGVALAEAEVRQAESELEFAEAEHKRALQLAQSRHIAERALEKAKLDAETRRAALARAKSNLEVRKREVESAEARLIGPEEHWKGEVPVGCCVKVHAPVSGRVLRVLQESEKVVAAGTPLVEIGDPANLEILVELLSADAVKVRAGAKATVESWGGPPVAAEVVRVEPAGFTKISALGIEEQRVRTILELRGSAEALARLGHDYRVLVRITVYEAGDVLRVPISALFRRGEEWAVFAVEAGRARIAPVEIGHRNSSFAELKKGLAAGAMVVLHPSDQVADGVRVAPSRQ